MPNERIPPDPYNPYRDSDFNRSARIDNEYQFDPELREGVPSRGRVALFAVAIVLLLGAVFYGLNHTNPEQASTAPPAQTVQRNPASPQTGMGDTTRPNASPGTTTGAAPSTAPSTMSRPPAGSPPDNK